MSTQGPVVHLGPEDTTIILVATTHVSLNCVLDPVWSCRKPLVISIIKKQFPKKFCDLPESEELVALDLSQALVE